MADLYRYRDFLVTSKRKPTGPHYAVVVLREEYENTSGYLESEGGSATLQTKTDYYFFATKEELVYFLDYTKGEKMNYFFFYVPKLGEAKLNISLEID